jgi:hypothetical protein
MYVRLCSWWSGHCGCGVKEQSPPDWSAFSFVGRRTARLRVERADEILRKSNAGI